MDCNEKLDFSLKLSIFELTIKGDNMVSILEVKKGTRVQLANGWYATIEDNKVTGHTRMATVEGYCTEMGSVYATDIRRVMKEDGSFYPVEHTPGQVKVSAHRKVFGF